MGIIDTALLQRFFTGLKPKFATAAQGKKADEALPKGSQAADAAKLAGYDPRWWMPAGVIVPYGGSSAPSGWLLCNGSAVSRTTYAGLFAVLGTTYGSGNGSTTFNLPDLRGRVAVGSDANLGILAGEAAHVLTNFELPIISGSFFSLCWNWGDPYGCFSQSNRTHDRFAASGSDFGTVQYNMNFGSGQSHNNMQPSLYLNYIIKI